MKTIKNLTLITLLAAFTSCVNSDEYNTPDLSSECVTLTATKTVTDITSAATSTATQYMNNDVIEAYVTSSDEGGNFYKSISFQSVDGTKGFSMPVDTYNLFNTYEPGRLVYINMKNRYVATSQSSVVIGNLFNGNVGRISGVEYKDVLKRGCTNVDEEEIVKKNLTIGAAKNNQYLNMLIEFNNVQFTEPSLGKKFYDPSVNSIGGATNHIITDEFGQTIIVRISEFANFASSAIPSGSGKIRGVLTKFNSDFQFMVRTINDVNLPNDRLEIDFHPPLGGTNIQFLGSYTENFESYTAGSVTTGQKVFPNYVNDAAEGGNYWYVETFSSNKYLKMAAFSSNSNFQFPVNKVYFIMPVNFTAANNMSFKSQDRFNVGGVLKVYYSTNYVALSNISNATLTDITSNFTIASGTTGSASLPFVNSGVYNFPASLTGNGYVIFEYTGGYSFSPVLTTTMHIDDVVIN